MLYLVVQLIFVILFAVQHPALGIVGVIAVQIYVRVPFTLKGVKIVVKTRYSPKTHTGHRTDTDSRPRGSRLVEYTLLWIDPQWSCIVVSVAAYVVNASTYWLQRGRIHGFWLAPSCRDARVRNQIEA
jgi:hypothetical protein